MKALYLFAIVFTLDMFSAAQVSSTATRARLFSIVMQVDSGRRAVEQRLDSTAKSLGRSKIDSNALATAMSDMLAVSLQSLSISGDSLTISRGNKVKLPLTAWGSIPGRPLFAAVATSGNYADLNGLPTIPVIPATYPWTAITGKPVDKRRETYSGVTNSSGDYTVTFITSYGVAPNIQANPVNQSNDNVFSRITAISATGFTVRVFQRSAITTLPIVGTLTAALLGATTTPVVGAAVDVIITEK